MQPGERFGYDNQFGGLMHQPPEGNNGRQTQNPGQDQPSRGPDFADSTIYNNAASQSDSDADLLRGQRQSIENVQVFIRVRPPFQSELDDYIFNPGADEQ